MLHGISLEPRINQPLSAQLIVDRDAARIPTVLVRSSPSQSPGIQGDSSRESRRQTAWIRAKAIAHTFRQKGATVQHVQIRHRRPDVSMTEQLLHRANDASCAG